MTRLGDTSAPDIDLVVHSSVAMLCSRWEPVEVITFMKYRSSFNPVHSSMTEDPIPLQHDQDHRLQGSLKGPGDPRAAFSWRR